MSSVNRVQILNHYNTGFQPVALIDYTMLNGPLAGVHLVEGKIEEHPEHGTIVAFDGYRNAAALKGKTPGNGGVDVLVKSRPDLQSLVAEARAMVAAELARTALEAASLKPIGYHQESGCDSGDTNRVIWPDGSSSAAQEIVSKDWPVALVAKHVKPAELKTIAADTAAEILPANMSTYGGYRFGPDGLDRLFSLARSRAADADARLAAKHGAANQAREEKLARALEQARSTGKAVVIERWTETCTDPREECDLDDVTRWVNPDGSFKVTRNHTW